MRIKFLFIFFALLLMTVTILLWLNYNQENVSWEFYTAQGITAFLLIYLIVFYRKVIKPMNTISYGMDLLREQDFSSRLSPVGQYEADHIVNIFNRMMEQLKNERLHLREQNHFLDLLINASPMGVIILSLDDEVTQLNPVAVRLLETPLEEAYGHKLKDLSNPLAAELAYIDMDETRIVRLNDANIYKCSHSSFIDHGFKHPFYLIERMTDEVVRAERKAYEKVIRMIAHEVNNTTAGITSALETIEDTLSTDNEMNDACDVAHACRERCFAMSRFITRFANVVKIPEPTMIPVRLNDLLENCTQFMHSMCTDRHINLRTELDPRISTVQMDSMLIEQVIVNIIKNAAESIGQNGEITISTSAPSTVTISDNGHGISHETEAKLFTPFFSTKPHGQGIGLVFIREVLRRHECTFSLHTDSDGLTRFCIEFPPSATT